MADEQREPRVKVQYTGTNPDMKRITVNGRKYPYDPKADKDGVLMPLGDATALVTGEPNAFRFASESRQAEVLQSVVSQPDAAESVDRAVSNEGGRAVSENANPTRKPTKP
jgi:hypothetical protein